MASWRDQFETLVEEGKVEVLKIKIAVPGTQKVEERP